MKTSIVIITATLAVLLPASRAQSQTDMVRIEVRVQTEQDRKDIKGTSAATVTQKKTLQIAISGKPKSPETRTGKWIVYGRDLKGNKIAVLDSGEFKLDLPASGQQKVESKVVSTSYTPEHSVASRAGKGKMTAKKEPAEGSKYAGYGVVVKDGEKIVGETFDPMGIKAEAPK